MLGTLYDKMTSCGDDVSANLDTSPESLQKVSGSSKQTNNNKNKIKRPLLEQGCLLTPTKASTHKHKHILHTCKKRFPLFVLFSF